MKREREVMAPTREEALAKLKELAPNDKRVYCDKIMMKLRRQDTPLIEDRHISR